MNLEGQADFSQRLAHYSANLVGPLTTELSYIVVGVSNCIAFLIPDLKAQIESFHSVFLAKVVGGQVKQHPPHRY